MRWLDKIRYVSETVRHCATDAGRRRRLFGSESEAVFNAAVSKHPPRKGGEDSQLLSSYPLSEGAVVQCRGLTAQQAENSATAKLHSLYAVECQLPGGRPMKSSKRVIGSVLW